MALGRGHDLLGRAFRHDPAAGGPTFGAQVDDPVRVLDHVQIVLHDEHRIAPVDESLQQSDQAPHVVEVEARRWLVQQIEAASRRPLREFGRQLDALGLAARQRGRGLAEPDVPQSHLVQRRENAVDGRDVGEELARVLHAHGQDVRDVLALVPDLESLPVVAEPAADIACDVDVRQEVHLDLVLAVAGAGLAAAALHVETEPTRLVTPGPRLRRLGHQGADRCEHVGVRRRVRARRATDGALVDRDHLVEMFQTLDPIVLAGRIRGAVEGPGQGLVQNLVDEAALAGAGHPGDQDEATERQVDVEIGQVVLARPADAQPVPVARPPRLRHRHFRLPAQVGGGKRALRLLDPGQRTFRDHLAAVFAGPRPEVDDPVGLSHRLLVVLDQQDRVAEVPHLLERSQQLGVVALVQTDRGLVQYVENPLELAADLGREPDPLTLAAGERPRSPVQVEVTQAHIP